MKTASGSSHQIKQLRAPIDFNRLVTTEQRILLLIYISGKCEQSQKRSQKGHTAAFMLNAYIQPCRLLAAFCYPALLQNTIDTQTFNQFSLRRVVFIKVSKKT